MNTNDILDEIINGLQPEDVPVEFIIMAKVIDHNGKEKTIRGKALAIFMSNTERNDMLEARVILDVNKIKLAILAEASDFFGFIRPPTILDGE